VAKPAVAELRVALMVEEPEVAVVKLPKGKRRRLDGDKGRVVEVEDEVGIIVAISVPRKLRGMVIVEGAPGGPKRMGIGPGVVNLRFPLFFNQSRRFAGEN